ncbi:MAG: M15 family metallopeptidase [Gammaproteobacteria bacterium]|nr:M15 family metallopeptidase [Gammaproteobacteria bacterium]
MRLDIVLLGLIIPVISVADQTCHYQSYRWNTLTRQAEFFESVTKSYADLAPHEIDNQTGCSVCIEDQRQVIIANLKPIRVCKQIAGQIEWILNMSIAEGFQIRQLRGYHVGRTRGEIDVHGRRTKFSNHSFGIAVDVNSDSNGLYENCVEFGKQCILRRGGDWLPDENPLSIRGDSLLVELMKDSGFLWGGEINGRQKDFMHFSVSGY